MAILVYTRDPAGLLRKIKSDIDQGKIATWSYDADGDFTHNADQWRNMGFLGPMVQSDHIRFRFIGMENSTPTRAVYGVYHGRFVEMLITHCSALVTKIDPAVNPAGDEPALA